MLSLLVVRVRAEKVRVKVREKAKERERERGKARGMPIHSLASVVPSVPALTPPAQA